MLYSLFFYSDWSLWMLPRGWHSDQFAWNSLFKLSSSAPIVDSLNVPIINQWNLYIIKDLSEVYFPFYYVSSVIYDAETVKHQKKWHISVCIELLSRISWICDHIQTGLKLDIEADALGAWVLILPPNSTTDHSHAQGG